jgi:hemoglobin
MVKKSGSTSHATRTSTTDLFEAIGGAAKCRELSTALYAHVGDDPNLRHLFPGKTRKCAIEEFAAFLAQFLGAPSAEARRRWWLSVVESHGRFQIGPKERAAWLRHMMRALTDVELSESMRSALRELFTEASAYVVNTGPAITAATRRSAISDIHAQLLSRWDEVRSLDDAVAAVRQADLMRVRVIIGGPLLQACFRRNRSVLAHFTGVLIGSGHAAMAEYAEKILHKNPDLAYEFYSGRTLLHASAAAGNLSMVAALLKLGVDANIKDSGGHTPLYSVANECSGGGSVVRALIKAGAKVDACDGVKHCTALHMAARRGNVEVAAALLESGADIEARDSLGETPLRRAVNCSQTGVAALLLGKGADPNSPGSKGLTPRLAARAASMRNLMEAWARQ